MHRGPRRSPIVLLTLFACLAVGVQPTDARQIKIEGAFPTQLPRGQTTVVSVAVPSRDGITAAEISPAAGVTIAKIAAGPNIQGALTWAELTIAVAKDAAPGERTLVLMLPMGRSTPLTLTIPAHTPEISALRVLSSATSAGTVDLQFAAADALADLGTAPYVWFLIGCGGDPLPGIVHGTLNPAATGSGIVSATIPRPPPPGGGAQAGKCDLQVRLTDAGRVESNTLTTTLDLQN
jgi:hypothetical protein